MSDTLSLKLLTHLQLKFSHLNKHKFIHNFRETSSRMCSSGAGVKTTNHFLFRCQKFCNYSFVLLKENF